MTMIRALLIYAAALTAFIVAGTVITNTPLEAVAWLVLLVEVVPLLTWAGAMLIRRASRKARDDWQHLSCDPVSRLPVNRAVGEIVAPAQYQIEAPKMELTPWHNGMD